MISACQISKSAMMKTTKVYIDDQQDSTGICCPNCRKITRVSISALGFKHHLNVKCSCKEVFKVEVEFRDKTRKLVDFPGSYEVGKTREEIEKSAEGKSWEEILFDSKEPNCRVIDLSRGGIGFLNLDQREIRVGNVVKLGFKLDNKYRKKVNQACQVKHVNGAFVGCSFLEENITINFYLTGKV